jgi:hypothetical protein
MERSELDFYRNAKIYRLIDNTNGNQYIGSTCKTLSARLATHTSDYRKYKNGNKKSYSTACEILKNEDYAIILIERCIVASNKEELRKIEREYIETMKCINKNMPCRSPEEKGLHKCKCGEQYTGINNKTYHENTNLHQNYISNLHTNCECGGKYLKRDKKRHENSIKHLKYITQKGSI